MGADWRWRSIPLHLACVVSTCLGLRQTLREIVWSRDERGLLFWSEPAGLHRDWAHLFDLHQLHGEMSASQILGWTSAALELVKHALCHCHPCFTFTQLACGMWSHLRASNTTAVLFPALTFTHLWLFTSVHTSGKNTLCQKTWVYSLNCAMELQEHHLLCPQQWKNVGGCTDVGVLGLRRYDVIIYLNWNNYNNGKYHIQQY